MFVDLSLQHPHILCAPTMPATSDGSTSTRSSNEPSDGPGRCSPESGFYSISVRQPQAAAIFTADGRVKSPTPRGAALDARRLCDDIDNLFFRTPSRGDPTRPPLNTFLGNQ